mmetsp:Transcript_5035/g.9268  ORF Transcript_5035/g.9268 Transcript_5035/m.9268 type:complete len:256 (+) Transcript_5035:1124-1891(+)
MAAHTQQTRHSSRSEEQVLHSHSYHWAPPASSIRRRHSCGEAGGRHSRSRRGEFRSFSYTRPSFGGARPLSAEELRASDAEDFVADDSVREAKVVREAEEGEEHRARCQQRRTPLLCQGAKDPVRRGVFAPSRAGGGDGAGAEALDSDLRVRRPVSDAVELAQEGRGAVQEHQGEEKDHTKKRRKTHGKHHVQGLPDQEATHALRRRVCDRCVVPAACDDPRGYRCARCRGHRQSLVPPEGNLGETQETAGGGSA